MFKYRQQYFNFEEKIFFEMEIKNLFEKRKLNYTYNKHK